MFKMMGKNIFTILPKVVHLTLDSIITPFVTFEIQHI